MLKNAEWTEARDLLMDIAAPVGTENAALEKCAGRVLGFDLRAEEDVPPFDRSAYDGYAMRAGDLASASREKPVTLRITETVPAGQVPQMPVGPGEAAHLMTGAKIPEGADCVIMFERTEFTEETVTVFSPLKPGDNIVRRGEDVARGALLAACGTVIDAGLAGTLAAQGAASVQVFRRPRIGLIATGREVVEADETPAPGQIRNANRAALTALLEREGCEPVYLGRTGDDAEEISGRIARGIRECDAVILTGGVSAGEWDLTPAAMEMAGAEIQLRGVNMKPGMACVFGTADGKPVLGLSGNPASAMTNFCACVLPALRKMAGKRKAMPEEIRARLIRPFGKKSPATRFLRGRLVLSDGTVRFEASPDQGNVVLSSAIGCDAFVMIPAGSGPLGAGTELKGFVL